MTPEERAAIEAELERITAAVAAIETAIAPEDPPDEEPPPPPPVTHTLTVPATSLRLVNPQSMVLIDDHIAVWGQPDEAVEFDITIDRPAVVKVSLLYVLATESQNQASSRDVEDAADVELPPTTDLWSNPVKGTSQPVEIQVPRSGTITVTNPTTSAWSNWCDLYAVILESEADIAVGGVVTFPPDDTPPPPPPNPGNGVEWNVPEQGSLASVADRARPGDVIYITGIVATDGKILDLKNRDNGSLPITIMGRAGHVLRGGESGIEGYGSCRGWSFHNLNIEVNARAYYSEGIYFGGQRTDQGGNGQGCSLISIRSCKIRPISGTGTIQRNGIAVWGSDVVEVGFCDISDASYNDLGYPGGAGSGISIGISIGSPFQSLPNGSRVWIHHNRIRNQRGPGTGSFDRNGIIMDLWHGTPGNPLPPGRSHGLVLIEDNDIADCEGRGIQLLMAGAEDSPVHVLRNKVTGSIATNLAGSHPIAAIGGYGDGRCGNVVCSDNDVAVTSGVAAYKFISFDAGFPAALRGVRGARNKGTPVVFENSPTNSVPAGFSS